MGEEGVEGVSEHEEYGISGWGRGVIRGFGARGAWHLGVGEGGYKGFRSARSVASRGGGGRLEEVSGFRSTRSTASRVGQGEGAELSWQGDP